MAPEDMAAGADVLQAETDTRVVHDADVGVAGVAREAAFLVRARGFEDHRGYYQQGFHLDVLCGSSSSARSNTRFNGYSSG
jgi:hypothetical protein